MKQIIIHRSFKTDMLRDLYNLRFMLRETLCFYGASPIFYSEKPSIKIDDIIRIDFYSGSVDKMADLKPDYANTDTYVAAHYLRHERGATLLRDINDVLNVVIYEVKKHKRNRHVNYAEMMTPRKAGITINPYTNLLKQIERNEDMNRRITLEGRNSMRIKNVIFNNPATIVFWNDGTKTVVKAENESFDPEKGLAMAIAKKSLGNKGDYYNEFKKWLPKETKLETKEKAKWKDPAEKVCSSCKYFTLDSSALTICQECLKDETLPNWEKADSGKER